MKHPPILFVDQDNKPIGKGSVLEAIDANIAMRVMRILLINTKGEVLVQRRSEHIFKPLLWNETATGHVDAQESNYETALRELEEEVGVSGVELSEIETWYFEEPWGDNQVKKGFHTLYTGHYDGPCEANPHEVKELRWISIPELRVWLESSPQDFVQGHGLQKFIARSSST